MDRIFTLGLLFFSLINFGADRKTIESVRTQEKIVIDGNLNESCWKNSFVASDFIQNVPVAGAPSCRKTDVMVSYDNQAIYVAAVMWDEKDSITSTLSQRDDVGNADWFGVIFDSYNAGTLGFSFIVTSAGVQVDELHQVDDIDPNWNAVWQSEISIHDDKWIAELKIPFSALRFPKSESQTWGINFARNIRRNREESYWNFYDPKGINLISQLGVLHGISQIESPVRLSVSPYVSGYIEHHGDNGTTSYTANGGMDLKYGLNESFTLDVTLIPDFGQVQFDNQVLNLSPFEVKFNERRQFFTEGTELFNKGDLFYSRRIGGTPLNYYDVYGEIDSNEIVSANPSAARLFNATKVSGRTQSGLGIGVFNAITAPSFATITNTQTNEAREIQTDPLTNYSVIVFDQNLKNNSSVTVLNTNVWRSGSAYDANVTSAAYNLYTKQQKYQTVGQFVLSQIYHEDSTDLGHLINFGFGKSAGQFTWGTSYFETSKSYNPNDLGYFFWTNQRTVNAQVGYSIFTPFWRLYNLWSSFSTSYTRNIDPNAFANLEVNAEVGGTFKNFLTAGFWLFSEPVITYDFYEPRVDGRFNEYPQSLGAGGFISSNYGKPFALDMRYGYIKLNDPGRYILEITTSPRLRLSDKFFVVLTNYLGYLENEEGVALDNNFNVPFDGDDPIFSIRDRFITENTAAATYIFTNRMGITFRLRHYWSKVEYESFYRLDDEGKFQPTTYTGLSADSVSLHNNSYNAFTIDMAYRWVFAPGSELSLVWKNSIFSFSDQIDQNYFSNVQNLFDFPATNSISLKILFYLDFWTVKQRFSKK
ncbi:MAG: carbohydrate binding family 9 domain-containing protein [Crocinitomicaceae bacterium]|nr:carbohydrate binding family 9 domain-containing protein [Crocinitomicaceae bacterium]